MKIFSNLFSGPIVKSATSSITRNGSRIGNSAAANPRINKATKPTINNKYTASMIQIRNIKIGHLYTKEDDEGDTVITFRPTQKIGQGGRKLIYKADVFRGQVTEHEINNGLSERPDQKALEVLLIDSRSMAEIIANFVNYFSYKEKVTQEIGEESFPDAMHDLIKECENSKAVLDQLDHCPQLHTEVSSPIPIMEEGEVVTIVPLLAGSLDGLLQGEMTLEKTLSILKDACKGMAYLHDEGLVHNDIKPENIFVSHGLDRGYLGDLDTMSKAGQPTLASTRNYAAPEKRYNDEGNIHAHPRQDCYSLLLTIDVVMTAYLADVDREPDDVTRKLKGKFITSIKDFCKDGLVAHPRPSANEILNFIESAEKEIKSSGFVFDQLGELNLTERLDKKIRSLASTLHFK